LRGERYDRSEKNVLHFLALHLNVDFVCVGFSFIAIYFIDIFRSFYTISRTNLRKLCIHFE